MKRKNGVDALLQQYDITRKELAVLLEARKQTIKVLRERKTAHYKFAIIADTHMVDKACAISELHNFYKICKKEGIKDVVHGGDMLSGMNVYGGQINDLLCFGVDDHLKYAVDNYPHEEGVTTYVIDGNHDMNYKKNAGVMILEHLSQLRKDIVYLGSYDATIMLNGVKIGLHHGSGGPAYAESYKIQKYIEKIGAGQKPQIYILAHYHSVLYAFYRNIHAFLPGSWQRPTDYSVRLGLPNMIGGWLVDLEVADDKARSITSISFKFIPYY